MIIAIDGPAASGKGTIARRLAAHYDLPHLDTGLLYRATARVLMDRGERLENIDAAISAARGLALTDFDEAQLRGAEMGEAASIVGAMPQVRAVLLDLQRKFASRPEGAILDGRDIGSIICPNADVKIFVTADSETRAQRRALELKSRGEKVDFAEVLADIKKRDERDSSRSSAPLIMASDAMRLDTSGLDIERSVAAAIAIVEGKKLKA
jgi:cytidylate kinase